MIAEMTAVILASTLASGNVKDFTDKEVNDMFNNQASSQNVGSTTKWVDVTRQIGKPHSLWLEKTKNNKWEMRGAM
jgi:hypothetical protein